MSPATKSSGRAASRAKEPSRGRRARAAIDDSLAQLEKQVPTHLKRLVQDFRTNLKGFQKQLDTAQAEREARWERLERQVRRDLAALLRRLEKAIEPGKPKRARPRKKKARPEAKPPAGA